MNGIRFENEKCCTTKRTDKEQKERKETENVMNRKKHDLLCILRQCKRKGNMEINRVRIRQEKSEYVAKPGKLGNYETDEETYHEILLCWKLSYDEWN